jgi:hypothetical protein
MYKIEVSTGLFLIGILALSCLSTNIFKQTNPSTSSAVHPDNKIQKFSNRFRQWGKD